MDLFECVAVAFFNWRYRRWNLGTVLRFDGLIEIHDLGRVLDRIELVAFVNLQDCFEAAARLDGISECEVGDRLHAMDFDALLLAQLCRTLQQFFGNGNDGFILK